MAVSITTKRTAQLDTSFTGRQVDRACRACRPSLGEHRNVPNRTTAVARPRPPAEDIVSPSGIGLPGPGQCRLIMQLVSGGFLGTQAGASLSEHLRFV